MPLKKHPPGLSFAGIPKNALHIILHNLLLQQVRAGAYNHKPQTTNRKPQTANYKPQTRHRFTLYQYYKNYRLLSRLKGQALCLLKTQFAKKPKNPV